MKSRALVLMLCASVACGKAAPPADRDPEPPASALRKVSDSGPVKITVEVWPEAPTLGDPIFVRLTTASQPGVTVDLPFQANALGRFSVENHLSRSARDGQLLVQSQTYELQAPSSGRHRIPPFRLEMIDGRQPTSPPAGDPDAGAATASPATTDAVEVLTEEIPVQVAPVAQDKLATELRPARGALATEVGGRPWWIWLIPLGALIALISSWRTWRRLRAQRSRRLKQSAYEAAVSRLRGLEDRGAPDDAGADAWFVELSGVVRRYLEGRYDIRAPELTTEEFLQVASRSPELRGDHRELLSQFMLRCDRVKFAGYRPDADESLATLRAARGFVEDTRLRAEPPAAT
jgi:hypothetical protein